MSAVSACAGMAGVRLLATGAHAASAMTPTVSLIKATMIVVRTVHVDHIKIRAALRWGLHHCQARSCPEPRQRPHWSIGGRAYSYLGREGRQAGAPCQPALVRSSQVFPSRAYLRLHRQQRRRDSTGLQDTVFNSYHSNKVSYKNNKVRHSNRSPPALLRLVREATGTYTEPC